MIAKYISCKQIIADFYRDVNPSTSDWIYNAIEWIGFGLGELGGNFNTNLVNVNIEVTEHRCKLPCMCNTIKNIVYKGAILPKYNTINIGEFDNYNFDYWNDLNVNYINTSFKEGTITIYYYEIETETDTTTGAKFPLIPDDGLMQVRNFLQEYILMKWLAQGNLHIVRTYAEVKAGIYTKFGDGAGLLHRAKNSVKFPATYDLDIIKSSFINLKKDWKYQEVELFNRRSSNSELVFTPNNYQ